MWVIRGRIVALANDRSVAPTEGSVFTGQVWIDDRGRIAAVTKGTRSGPREFADAPVVDVGNALVMPGLVDLHNHLAYNTLPLWTEPSQTVPFLHHNSWTRAKTYAASTTWPAYALITACPQELLAYVEAKAIVGGTTSIQGSPPKNRPRDGWLVRNIEDEKFDSRDPNLIYASVLTAKPAALAERATKMRAGSTFIYHCAEGRRGSIVTREYTDAEAAGCLQRQFIAVHANAVGAADLSRWPAAGAIAWSPFSNLWLYGETTDVPAARDAGLNVCLGSDWAPSGTKQVLGELKAARLTADHLGWSLTDQDLVMMATCRPGDALAQAWDRQVGRLQPGAQADLVVINAARAASPFRTIVAATEDDVDLVVVDGQPRYGTPDLMAGVSPSTTLPVNGRSMRLGLSQPSDPNQAWEWDEVLERLEEVRANPKREVEASLQACAFAARTQDGPVPSLLRLALDMPTGLSPIGGLPKDLNDLVVPPLQSLTHDQAWLDSVVGRGFHGGVLDGLATYYR
ncbi:MAG TPA: amidohydrolase family protein [Propionibacteriaceae bacterium]|nr:amidohydrolase family protein [Propionibacteriaceae bacterium]